jgi:hypothetical protein
MTVPRLQDRAVTAQASTSSAASLLPLMLSPQLHLRSHLLPQQALQQVPLQQHPLLLQMLNAR